MELIARLAALCLLSSVLILFLKKNGAEFSFLLLLAAVLVGALYLAEAVSPVLALCEELLAMTQLDEAVFMPLFKVMAVALIVRLGGALCRDAGQSALCALLEIAGGVCALWCAMPLVRAVVDMLGGWI